MDRRKDGGKDGRTYRTLPAEGRSSKIAESCLALLKQKEKGPRNKKICA